MESNSQVKLRLQLKKQDKTAQVCTGVFFMRTDQVQKHILSQQKELSALSKLV